jgi:homoserine O-acetyltransferase
MDHLKTTFSPTKKNVSKMQVATHVTHSRKVSLEVMEPLVLECGDVLRDLRIHYTTYGNLNASKSNVVWVFHALTGSSDVAEWWPGLIGEGKVFDPKHDFIICANMLGSCYGSTEAVGFDFPLITIKDMVKAHKMLHKDLGLGKIKVGIGGSMGGQQLLEWAVQEPELFETIVPLATNAKHSAWGIAFNEVQRMALEGDPNGGIKTARAIGMLSYRSVDIYSEKQTDTDGRMDDFSASAYQRYQGEKLQKRFSPYSYHSLSRSMDSHNVGRGRGSVVEALSKIKSKAVVIGMESDLLFPIQEQELIADHIPNSTFHPIASKYGHDGFLVEVEQIATILNTELN